MTFEFRDAKRERVSLIIGLAGGTGSGKTMSALKLATGMAGGAPFAFIDTESGRGLFYADSYVFKHGDLKPPFRPDAYAAAIKAADDAKFPVVVVDSFSHSWAGEGGVLDWQENELDRMAGQDWKKREACKMAAWIKPKMSMKAMVQRLLQVRAHLIICLRAEQRIEMVRGADGKMEIREKQSLTGLNGWIPVCEKNLPYEFTASFLLMADRPGVPLPIKLQQQHKDLFPLDQAITEASGERLAAWAKGVTISPPRDIDTTKGPREVPSSPDGTARVLAGMPLTPWQDQIAGATSREELLAVGTRLTAAATSMPSSLLNTLRKAYAERLKKFPASRAKKPTTLSAADDIQWTP